MNRAEAERLVQSGAAGAEDAVLDPHELAANAAKARLLSNRKRSAAAAQSSSEAEDQDPSGTTSAILSASAKDAPSQNKNKKKKKKKKRVAKPNLLSFGD